MGVLGEGDGAYIVSECGGVLYVWTVWFAKCSGGMCSLDGGGVCAAGDAGYAQSCFCSEGGYM